MHRSNNGLNKQEHSIKYHHCPCTDDVRVQLFPYICALLAIGVILVVSKVIFNYWRRRHPVGEPSKAIQPDIGKGVNVSVNPAIGVVEGGGGDCCIKRPGYSVPIWAWLKLNFTPKRNQNIIR